VASTDAGRNLTTEGFAMNMNTIVLVEVNINIKNIWIK
jgi:hypothetical protein